MLDFGNPGAFRGGGGAGGNGAPAVADGSRVSIQPASFNRTSTLGRVAQITYNPTSDQLALGIYQVQTLVFWQGGKVEAQAMTVDIGTVQTPVPKPHSFTPQSARTYVEMQYGVDGNIQNAVRFDAGTGRRVTVVANYVSVNVGMDAPRDGNTAPVLTYGASLGTFAAPSQAPLISSVYIDNLAAATPTDFLLVPLRATVLLVPTPVFTGSTGAYNGKITVNFYSFGGSIVGQWTWDYATGIGFAPVPIPADAFVFSVVTAASGTTDVRIPFQLSL